MLEWGNVRIRVRVRVRVELGSGLELGLDLGLELGLELGLDLGLELELLSESNAQLTFFRNFLKFFHNACYKSNAKFLGQIRFKKLLLFE